METPRRSASSGRVAFFSNRYLRRTSPKDKACSRADACGGLWTADLLSSDWMLVLETYAFPVLLLIMCTSWAGEWSSTPGTNTPVELSIAQIYFAINMQRWKNIELLVGGQKTTLVKETENVLSAKKQKKRLFFDTGNKRLFLKAQFRAKLLTFVMASAIMWTTRTKQRGFSRFV